MKQKETQCSIANNTSVSIQSEVTTQTNNVQLVKD